MGGRTTAARVTATQVLEGLRGWLPRRPRRLPAGDHERLLAGARIERHGGLTALYLHGTPYQMGYQHGVLARDLIHGFRLAAYEYVATLVPGPDWLARPLLSYYAAAYWPTIPADLAEEMRGIADGAGVHSVEVLASTAIWEMFLVSGCSEFAAVGPVTASGSLLHGYNYDLMHPDHALIQPYLAALFFRPDQGLPFVTVNTVGSVGANAGMNEAGVSVAWDNTNLKDDSLVAGIERPVVPFIIALRRLLQTSESLDEAVRTVTTTLPRPLGDIIIIGSANESRAVALETAGHLHAVREMEEGVVWSTNCFRSPELAAYDQRGNGQGLPEERAWQRFPRYTAYKHLFDAHRGQLDARVAAALLRDPYPRESEGYLHPVPLARATICRDITSWSLVMEPGEGRLWASDTRLPGCQGPFYAFDLGAWQRLPKLDLAPTGYHAALRCAESFVAGHHARAADALEQALAQDGPTAPLLLMQAMLQGLAGERQRALACLEQVDSCWGGTSAGALARAWLGGSPDQTSEVLETSEVFEDGPPTIPFPSAIRPVIHLRPANSWEDRAVPASIWNRQHDWHGS